MAGISRQDSFVLSIIVSFSFLQRYSYYFKKDDNKIATFFNPLQILKLIAYLISERDVTMRIVSVMLYTIRDRFICLRYHEYF